MFNVSAMFFLKPTLCKGGVPATCAVIRFPRVYRYPGVFLVGVPKLPKCRAPVSSSYRTNHTGVFDRVLRRYRTSPKTWVGCVPSKIPPVCVLWYEPYRTHPPMENYAHAGQMDQIRSGRSRSIVDNLDPNPTEHTHLWTSSCFCSCLPPSQQHSQSARVTSIPASTGPWRELPQSSFILL